MIYRLCARHRSCVGRQGFKSVQNQISQRFAMHYTTRAQLCIAFLCFNWQKHHHDDVIEWKHFRRYRPFVRGIHRSQVNSPRREQWSGALMFSLICTWINGWVNNREAGDLRRHRAHYDETVMINIYKANRFGNTKSMKSIEHLSRPTFYGLKLCALV